MKTIFIRTAFVIGLTTFGSAAYGQVDTSNTKTCQSTLPARPTGGATRERIAAVEKCDRVQSEEQQEPSTSPMEQTNPPSSEPSPYSENQAPDSSTPPSTPDSTTP